MINKAGREIPDDILKDGLEVYQGVNYKDGHEYRKAAPKVNAFVDRNRSESKILGSIKEAIEKSGLKDGMTISFHHHFRNGDYVVNMVMDVIASMGIKDLTICASSLGEAHDPIIKYIEDGTITGLSSSGVRGKIGEAISYGKLKNIAYIRSHGGRVRAIESGDVHIDVAFIGAPTSDEYGNARGKGGKSDCGVLSYAMVDAKYADKVVIITDCLVDFPNFPPSIEAVDVDYVVVVDEIGDPKKIASKEIRFTQDPKEIIMAEMTAKFIASTPYFKDGFSFQTGAGGASLAATRFMKPYMDEKEIKMSFAIGGITGPLVELMEQGYIRVLVDAQDFDLQSVDSVHKNRNHYEISTSQYANPFNKGAFVNKLDFVVLGALEVDVDYNVNVVVGSDGVVRGAPGGHTDTSAGAKVTIIVAPLLRGRIPTVLDKVTTITTPGDSVDVLITEIGIAINPKRTDLIEAIKQTDLPLMTIEEMRDRAYAIAGKPDDVEFEDKVVALIEYRDGTILDVVRQAKPYSL